MNLRPSNPKLEAVLALDPTEVVGELIKILHGGLRRVGIGSDVGFALIVKGQVRETVETRNAKLPTT